MGASGGGVQVLRGEGWRRKGQGAEGREEGNFVGRTFLKLNLKRAVL